jgi:hypothetical protein
MPQPTTSTTQRVSRMGRTATAVGLCVLGACADVPYDSSLSALDGQGDGGVPLENEEKTLSEDQLAAQNRKVVGCYAQAAAAAYDSPGATTVCKYSLVDPRNSMGAWTLLKADTIWKAYVRTTGYRQELLITMRGSQSTGDWLRDTQSQVQSAEAPADNAISSMKSRPMLALTGVPRFNAGFHQRVNNLASAFDKELDALERWRAQDPKREIGVKIAGHSLGAATATMTGLYVANRYASDVRADVEVFAFNSPKIGNTDMAASFQSAAASCRFNVHVFNNRQDVVSALPTNSSQIYGTIETSNAFTSGEQICRYDGGYNRNGADAKRIHLPGPFGSLVNSANRVAAFALSRHDINQWIAPGGQGLTYAEKALASNWLPTTPLGSPVYKPATTINLCNRKYCSRPEYWEWCYFNGCSSGNL